MSMFTDPAERVVWTIAKRSLIVGDDGAVLSGRMEI